MLPETGLSITQWPFTLPHEPFRSIHFQNSTSQPFTPEMSLAVDFIYDIQCIHGFFTGYLGAKVQMKAITASQYL